MDIIPWEFMCRDSEAACFKNIFFSRPSFFATTHTFSPPAKPRQQMAQMDQKQP